MLTLPHPKERNQVSTVTSSTEATTVTIVEGDATQMTTGATPTVTVVMTAGTAGTMTDADTMTAIAAARNPEGPRRAGMNTRIRMTRGVILIAPYHAPVVTVRSI